MKLKIGNMPLNPWKMAQRLFGAIISDPSLVDGLIAIVAALVVLLMVL